MKLAKLFFQAFLYKSILFFSKVILPGNMNVLYIFIFTCFINLKLFYNKFVRTSLRIFDRLVSPRVLCRTSLRHSHVSESCVVFRRRSCSMSMSSHLSSNDTIDNKFIGDFHTMSFSIFV